MKLLKRIYNWFRSRHMYVIADATDNSITFSHALFHHMGGLSLEQAKVFAFYVPAVEPRQGHYGFILNPSFEQETQLADIQYNTKHRTIGFETLNPTVNRIFYDYGMPALIKAKLDVKVKTAGDITYYQICPPVNNVPSVAMPSQQKKVPSVALSTQLNCEW